MRDRCVARVLGQLLGADFPAAPDMMVSTIDSGGRHWFVNPAVGDDRELGTQDQPLRTWAELRRRLWPPTEGGQR